MSIKRKIQMVVDLAMTIMLPVLMAYSMVGEAVHEWLGISIFIMFFLHHLLNWQWHKNIVKGRYSALRVFGLSVNILLTVVMIVLPVSGIMMAKHTLNFLDITAGVSLARLVHLIASYWGFVLMSVHLGLHWNMIMRMVRKAANISLTSYWRTLLFRVVAIVIAGYGLYSFLNRKFVEYMFLKSQFVFFDLEESLFFFFIDYISIMGFFVFLGYYFSKLLVRTTGSGT